MVEWDDTKMSKDGVHDCLKVVSTSSVKREMWIFGEKGDRVCKMDAVSCQAEKS